MKQGKPVITFVILVLAAALAIYLGFYAFGALNEPFTTTLAYQYTARDSAEASGLLVREEQVLTAQCNRLAAREALTREDLMKLTAADVDAVRALPKDKKL